MTTKVATDKKTEKTLNDLFMGELEDIYDAERRLTRALPKMANAAMANGLKKAINSHLKETEGHLKTLEKVFAAFDKKAKGKKCEAIEGLLKEGEEIADEFEGTQACDAAVISACQKVEHYEIASYGCLHEWAGLLGNEKAVTMLSEILEEEKAANEALTELARAVSNDEALGEETEDESPKKKAAKSKSNGR